MHLRELVDYLDHYLDIASFDDRSNNGLQVEGAADVNRVAFCVDASDVAIAKAAEAGAQMLVVHHGMFWSEPIMVRGAQRRRLQALLQHGVSLYAAHLPLDAHPEVGNNVEMSRLLGLRAVREFGVSHGRAVGIVAEAEPPLALEELRRRLEAAIAGPASVWPNRETVRTAGIITGNAMGMVSEATAAGLDALVCGELGHMVFHDAREAGLAVVLGGHYLTETVGLKALARHLAGALGVETVWVEVPTGL